MSARVLLHVCCVHCAAYTIEFWQGRSMEVTTYWFNPNIHPHDEHGFRLEAMRKYIASKNVPLITGEYDPISYFKDVARNGGDRCNTCFKLRLRNTASEAKKGDFSGFTTTLLISPQQKHELIIEAGTQAAKDNGVEFLYADLRKRYSDSRHITKPMELYRQQYCGCIYSRLEREQNPSSKKE
jgi:predicted adenine nucleotide alpha hydrolase (AANH) superfamily ATPase